MSLVGEPLHTEELDHVEVVDDRSSVPRRGGWVRRLWRRVQAAGFWLFGVLSLVGGLAVVATVPVLQFLSLGYLLECSGRVARTGRLRDGFVDVPQAARIGSIVLGTWLVLLPIRLISRVWYASYLIDPTSTTTRNWRIALLAGTCLAVTHILWAWSRGGKLRHFFWPAPVAFVKRLRHPRKYSEVRDAVWDFVVSLRLPYYFWLGLRGFLLTMGWLLVPITLFIGATTLPTPLAILSGLIGSVWFAAVVLHLPFLQTNFAMRQRAAALFDLPAVYNVFYRAPISCWLAVLITLAFALPLYLLKIELTPREVAVLPSLVFVAFIWPARLLTGWAVGRARRAAPPRRRWLRIAVCTVSLATILPVSGFYVLVVFFTRYTSWYGLGSLFEQHAFLLPVPFLGL